MSVPAAGDIVVRHVPGCPGAKLAMQRVRRALRRCGVAAAPRTEVVETPEQARRLGFRGSPTILIDGVDPFAADAPPIGMTCRRYTTPAGVEGAPALEAIMAAIAR